MTPAAGSDDDALTRVGRAVALRRVEVGLDSQQALAERAGVGLSTAALLERGQTWPRKANAHKIEIALEWPPGTLEGLRRGKAVPSSPDASTGTLHTSARPLSAASAAAPISPQTLAITQSLVQIAGTVVQNLAAAGDAPAARAMMEKINRHLLDLEAQLVVSLPDLRGESFDETMSTFEELHRRRVELEAFVEANSA